ncbi:hypothetical protein B0H14DRAFT_3757899 [Mycena olivaceomarginata]|nr:hypothetical protein B0H14DRAFT_3757899 [Mycena olivaceomarginata]
MDPTICREVHCKDVRVTRNSISASHQNSDPTTSFGQKIRNTRTRSRSKRNMTTAYTLEFLHALVNNPRKAEFDVISGEEDQHSAHYFCNSGIGCELECGGWQGAVSGLLSPKIRFDDNPPERNLKASKIRKFSYTSRVTGVEYENRQNVTKSLKIAPKIEISAYTVARAVVFARAALVDSFGHRGSLGVQFNASKQTGSGSRTGIARASSLVTLRPARRSAPRARLLRDARRSFDEKVFVTRRRLPPPPVRVRPGSARPRSARTRRLASSCLTLDLAAFLISYYRWSFHPATLPPLSSPSQLPRPSTAPCSLLLTLPPSSIFPARLNPHSCAILPRARSGVRPSFAESETQNVPARHTGPMCLGCASLMLDVPAPRQRHRVWVSAGARTWVAANGVIPIVRRRLQCGGLVMLRTGWLLHRVHCQSATGSRPARIGTQDGEWREDRVRVREGRKWEGGWRTEEWVVHPLPAHRARGV